MQKGFTLLEAVLTMMILAGGIVGVLNIFQQNIERSNETEQTLTATMLAEEKLEQMIHDRKYQGYNFIAANNYPATEDLTPLGYPGYTRTINIQEVNRNNLSAAQNNSGYKKVVVGVSMTGGTAIALDSLVTEWGLPPEEE